MKFQHRPTGGRSPGLLTWLTAVAVLWVGLLVAAPFGWPAALMVLVYEAASHVCHQLPERSFHIQGVQLPVCARCAGIYVGAALILTIQLITRPRAPERDSMNVESRRARMWLALGVLPALLSVVLEQGGWWSGSNVLRALTGVALGAAVALVAARAATINYDEWRQRRLV